MGEIGVGIRWSFMVRDAPGIVTFDAPRIGDVSVMVGKTDGRPAGMIVRFPGCIFIGIDVGGWIGRWNQRYPDYSVSAGDQIIDADQARNPAAIHS